MNTLELPFDIKEIGAQGRIEGLAAAFGNVDLGGDRILPGAFAKNLAQRAGRHLPMLLHHDKKRPIGVWTELQETGEGLYAKGQLTMATRDAQEAHALASDGALTGLSIGYQVPASGQRGMGQTRELSEIILHETSLVTIPMNDRARVRAVKSISSIRDLEELLCEGGLSGRKAKVAATAAWKAINQASRDSDAKRALADLLTKTAARLG